MHSTMFGKKQTLHITTNKQPMSTVNHDGEGVMSKNLETSCHDNSDNYELHYTPGYSWENSKAICPAAEAGLKLGHAKGHWFQTQE